LNIGGKDHTLAGEDLLLSMEPVEGYQVESESGHAVALALELDESLLKEGTAREIVHAVQQARKNAGLEITDRITLWPRPRANTKPGSAMKSSPHPSGGKSRPQKRRSH